MRQGGVCKVVIHMPESIHALSFRLNAFYIEVLERRLGQSNLTMREKILVLNRIFSNMKSGEAGEAVE